MLYACFEGKCEDCIKTINQANVEIVLLASKKVALTWPYKGCIQAVLEKKKFKHLMIRALYA